MISKTSTHEYAAVFLAEQRTEAYIKYGEGAAQAKMLLNTKNALQAQACIGQGRHGVEVL